MKRKGTFHSVGKFSTEVDTQIPKDLTEYFMTTVSEIDIVAQYIYSIIDIRRTLDENFFNTIKYALAVIYAIGRNHGRQERDSDREKDSRIN